MNVPGEDLHGDAVDDGVAGRHVHELARGEDVVAD
jgi:hypothetical protein